MPPASSKSVEALLDETAQSNLCLTLIRLSIKRLTVLPVPMPNTESLLSLCSICSRAASATLLFSSFCFRRLISGAYKSKDVADAGKLCKEDSFCQSL